MRCVVRLFSVWKRSETKITSSTEKWKQHKHEYTNITYTWYTQIYVHADICSIRAKYICKVKHVAHTHIHKSPREVIKTHMSLHAKSDKLELVLFKVFSHRYRRYTWPDWLSLESARLGWLEKLFSLILTIYMRETIAFAVNAWVNYL